MKKGAIAPIIFLVAAASPSLYRVFGPQQVREHMALNIALIVCFLALAVVIAIIPAHPASKRQQDSVAKGTTDS